jgi:hypothetical protein
MGWSLNCSDAFSLPAMAGLPGFVRLSAHCGASLLAAALLAAARPGF